MKVFQLTVGPSTALAVILAGSLSCDRHANHAPPAHGHAEHSGESDHSATPTAQSYADAIRQIQSHMTSLDAIIKSGDYDAVHKDCVAIEKLCDAIGGAGGMASAQGSPVPNDKVSEVAESARQLSAASRSLHKAAHADDLAQVKADYARMEALARSLASYTPGG